MLNFRQVPDGKSIRATFAQSFYRNTVPLMQISRIRAIEEFDNLLDALVVHIQDPCVYQFGKKEKKP